MEINIILFAFVSYFIGSIPFAYILTSFFGYGDIRNIGSGNIGATNVLRTGKKSLAISVLFFDIIKGFLPVTFFFIFYNDYFQEYIIIFIGSLAIIGHIFPIWLKFKGGKGVATYIGFLLGIDYILGIIFVISWLIIAFFSKYSSLASICSLIVIPFFSVLLLSNIALFIISLTLSLIIIIKHNSNIKRLLNNSENKIKF